MSSGEIHKPGLWMLRITVTKVDGVFKAVTKNLAFDERMDAETIRQLMYPRPDPPDRFGVLIVECGEHLAVHKDWDIPHLILKSDHDVGQHEFSWNRRARTLDAPDKSARSRRTF